MELFIIVGIIIGSLYFVALINRIFYLGRIYSMDLHNLEQQRKSEVAAMRTRMIREGTMRYASATAKGIVNEIERVANERIERRKLEYRNDLISSFVTTITSALKN